MSLKVVKFDKKMYLNFKNFWGQTSDWGGTSLGPQTGTSVGWGGLAKFLPDGGTPQSPQEKNHGGGLLFLEHQNCTWMCLPGVPDLENLPFSVPNFGLISQNTIF